MPSLSKNSFVKYFIKRGFFTSFGFIWHFSFDRNL